MASSAREDGCDLVATSFGMTQELVDFWTACAFEPARVGLRREASSGAHTLMMLRPLTAPGEALAKEARRRLRDALPALAEGPLADLEKPLITRLRARLSCTDRERPPDEGDWEEAAAFAFAQRGPDAAFAALRRVTRWLGTTPNVRPDPDTAALQARFLEAVPWPEVASQLGCTGRKATIARLRGALGVELRARADGKLGALIARLGEVDASG